MKMELLGWKTHKHTHLKQKNKQKTKQEQFHNETHSVASQKDITAKFK